MWPLKEAHYSREKKPKHLKTNPNVSLRSLSRVRLSSSPGFPVTVKQSWGGGGRAGGISGQGSMLTRQLGRLGKKMLEEARNHRLILICSVCHPARCLAQACLSHLPSLFSCSPLGSSFLALEPGCASVLLQIS